MGKKDPIAYCLDEARGLESEGHHGAALIYLIQAAEIAAKHFLQSERGVRVPYFSACIPHLREVGLISGDEESKLRQINTMRNLAIHSGAPVSKEWYTDAKRRILKLMGKLKRRG